LERREAGTGSGTSFVEGEPSTPGKLLDADLYNDFNL
jgi:hypothetical protein